MERQQTDTVTVAYSTAVYSLAAIKKAAYRLGDRCYCHISAPDPVEGTVQVVLTPKPGVDSATLAAEFSQEVLDQDLRECVAEQTAGIRAAIIAQAFSSPSLVAPALDTADFRDDPLGIDRPAEPPASRDK